MAKDLVVQPIRKERISLQVALQICRMVRDGQLQPGDSLPSERDLASRLGVSRASLREALRGLEVAGIVETKHGGGTVVRSFSAFGTESALAMVFEASHDNVADLWEVRRIVEPALAERAAVRASDEEVEWLGRMLERHHGPYSTDGDPELPRAMDREFHGGVASLTGNDAAEQVIQLLNTLVHRGYHALRAFAIERRRLAYQRHIAIYEAIRDRDPDTARRRMLAHLEEVEEYILGELIDGQHPVHSGASYVDVSERTQSEPVRGGGGTSGSG